MNEPMIKGLVQDLRYGVRNLSRQPAFVAVLVITLALAIGVNTSLFTIVNAALLRPLTYADPDRLVLVWERNVQTGRLTIGASYPDFEEWRQEVRSFRRIAASRGQDFTLTGVEQPERLHGLCVSSDLFSLLGVNPQLGRTFLPQEQETNANVVLLADALWTRQFRRDPAIVGKSVVLDDRSFTVVGILPAGFRYPPHWVGIDPEVWIPLSKEVNRKHHYLTVVARLAPGARLDQVKAELESLAARRKVDYPESHKDLSARVLLLHEQVVGEFRSTLLILLAAVGCILLIACANVANLMLARASNRFHEMGVRCALGASRVRLIRQVLSESVLVSCTGGVIGAGFAIWGARSILFLMPSDKVPGIRADGLQVDWRVLAFTAAVSIGAGLLFGLAPAFQLSGANVIQALKSQSRGSTSDRQSGGRRSLLVVSELAISTILLVGAGLLIKSFILLQAINPGFQSANVSTVELYLGRSHYPENPQMAAFVQTVLDRVGGLPGTSVGAVDTLPLSGDSNMESYTYEGASRTKGDAGYSAVAGDYFRALSIPLVQGRSFTPQDTTEAPPVMVVSSSLAQRLWGHETAIGKRLTVGSEKSPRQVVGVVGDIRLLSLEREPRREMYVPLLQSPDRSTTLVVKTAIPFAELVKAVRNEIRMLDRDQPVLKVRTMDEIQASSVASRRFSMIVLSLFAMLAILLSAVGVYSVLAYIVEQRRPEIGLRLAVGARPVDILKLMLTHGGKLILLGVVSGIALSLGADQVLSSMLFGVVPADKSILTYAVALLATIGLLACLVPALRASQVDPLVALRTE